MDALLERLARLHGIEPGYHDIWGNWRGTSDATAHAILAALGVDARDPQAVERMLATEERAAWSRAVPPITVLRAAELAAGVRIHLPEASHGRPHAWRIAGEGGELYAGPLDPSSLRILEEKAGPDWRARALALPLPADLPEGYHRLALLRDESVLGSGTIAVVPQRCYEPPAIAAGARLWGPSVQLYGVRSARNAGIGNFVDLCACAEAWGAHGAGIVGTNPLHALSLRDPGYGSPYSPSSRLFLNTFYIDAEAVPDFAELAAGDPGFLAAWRATAEALRATELVAYARVAEALRGIFAALHESFRAHHLAHDTPRARAFARFRESGGAALARHALHEAMSLHFGGNWQTWPEDCRDPEGAGAARFRDENPAAVGLHEYLQWQAELQLAHAQARCRALGMPIGVYADLAVSASPDGADAWANQALHALGVNVGAPPDDFNTAGQDWGLPPLAPGHLRAAGYAPFIAMLRANMARVGALRIDHVMGVSRQFWVPHGMKATEGAYVRFPASDLLGLIALESQRARCLVIGEDLGTVSDELRRQLADCGMLSYRLFMFERDGGRFRSPAEYSSRALVAWSTHDLATLRGWWAGRDLEARAGLGLLEAHAMDNARRERGQAREALVRALVEQGVVEAGTDAGGPATDAICDGVQAFLGRTPSPVLVVQMEDVLGLEEQANLPGTVTEHPNWRRKLPVPVEAWGSDDGVRRVARRLTEARGGRHEA